MTSRTVRGDSKPTIYQVAELAGVSAATVSNAFNRPERVGATTFGKVMAAVDELGFTPKAAAVLHARKGVGRIGVLAPFTSYDSFRTRLVGVLEASRTCSVEIAVFDQESAAETASPLLSTLPATGRLDGLLVMGLPLQDAMAERLVRRNLPTVLVDSTHESLTSVVVDDEYGGRLAGEHLLTQGHRRFAYVSERQQSMTFISQGVRRLTGFRSALADAGLGDAALQHVITSHDVAGGRRAALEIATWQERPDAVFAHFDEIGAGLISGFRSQGMSVPGDIAVIGYDDSPLAEAMDLTTVSQPLAESGRIGCELLLEQLAGGSHGVQHTALLPQLVTRSSA